MKFLLFLLMQIGVLNSIWARSLYWGPYHSHNVNPWSNYDYNEELFGLPLRKNSDEETEFEKISKLFDEHSEESKERNDDETNVKATQLREIESFLDVVLGGGDVSQEDSKEHKATKTSDKLDKSSEDSKEHKLIKTKEELEDDSMENLRSSLQSKEIERILKSVMGGDSREDETKTDKKSSETKTSDEVDRSSEDSKEHKKIKTSDELLEDDSSENLRDFESILNAIMGGDSSEDETKPNPKAKESSKDNDKDDNSEETSKNKDSEEEKESLDKYESKESNEILTSNKNEENIEIAEESEENISEKDIKELTAILVTLSNLDELMKIAENTSANEVSLTDEEFEEKQLKEFNEYLTVFSSLLDKLLNESSEVVNENENSNNAVDDDKSSKEYDSKTNNKDSKDDNNNDDSSVSLEFHDIENSKTNFDIHRYDLVKSSTVTAELKPTSSPYLPENFLSNADNNDVIQQYVEVREKIDNLQDDLLLSKLNMDKDFYNIIANESDDKNMKLFANDIAIVRDNAYKLKRSIDDMQDIKSKLYFHKLIKAALKEIQFK